MTLPACDTARRPEAAERTEDRHARLREVVDSVRYGKIIVTKAGGQIVEIERIEKERFGGE